MLFITDHHNVHCWGIHLETIATKSTYNLK